MPRIFYKMILFGIFLTCAYPLSSQAYSLLEVPIQSSAGFDFPLYNVGGLRSPQFSNIDFNRDGIQDLLVFDRNGNMSFPLIKINNDQQINYLHRPEYRDNLPPLQSWVIVQDYNNDGIEDIFTESTNLPGSIALWRGYVDGGILKFRLLTFDYGLREILEFFIQDFTANVYVNTIDIPGIADVDRDGDIDIVSFESNGVYANYYKNVSVEEGLGIDSVKFIRETICWGGFAENELSSNINFSSNMNDCAQPFISHQNGTRHSGSTTCLLDGDGDGDYDVLIGDLASSKIYYLTNTGDLSRAHITEADFNFPSYDIPIQIDIFNSAFYVDINNDGHRDLIVTTNEESSGDNINHIWWYENIQTDSAPTFRLKSKNLLYDMMPYYHSGSHPTFVDINRDGLKDIVIGTNGIYKNFNKEINFMVLLLNVGTLTEPKYEEVDLDFLSFSDFSNSENGRFAPHFGDLDGDGDDDLLVGDKAGTFFFVKNTANSGESFDYMIRIYEYIFSTNAPIGSNIKPFIFDFDEDGLQDIIIGEKNNQLNFIKNIGTVDNPAFSPIPTTTNMGQLFSGLDFKRQMLSPYFFKDKYGQRHLVFGTDEGSIWHYHINSTNPMEPFILQTDKLGHIQVGIRSTPSMADIDNDGFLEMVVGNERGGLIFYKTTFEVEIMTSLESVSGQKATIIYPNPCSELCYFTSNMYDFAQVRNLLGHTVLSLSNTNTLDVSHLPNGMYLIEFFRNNTRIKYTKIIVQNP